MSVSGPPGAQVFAAALDHYRAGRVAEAVHCCERLLQAQPGHAPALHLLGFASMQLGQFARAVNALEHAVAADPRNHEALIHLGMAVEQMGAPDSAAACFLQALEIDPKATPAHERLGYLRFAQGRFDDAALHFGAAVALQPQSAGGHNNLGAALGAAGKRIEAVDAFARAVALDPTFADAWLNYAQLLDRMQRHSGAIEAYRCFSELRPDHAAAHYRRGVLHHHVGDWAGADQALRAALALDPHYTEARWVLTMAQLPPVYDATDSPAAGRARFEHEFAALDAWFDQRRTPLGPKVVGSIQPFYLAYDEQNHRDLLARYGDLCARLMAPAMLKPPRRAHARRDRLRVGVVSGHFYDQSVWTAIVRGWAMGLDRSGLELTFFHTKRVNDAETEVARLHCDAFVQEPSTLEGWIDAIRERDPDALLYPDFGMDAMTGKLAALRLAPVQWASWGHPETTGLPTIDAYISAAAFEPEHAQQHYREQLIALPGIGTRYSWLDVREAEIDFAALGIEDGRPMLLCPGTPYKYLPRHDAIFAAIAARVPCSTLVFFTDIVQELSQRLERRLSDAFRHAGSRPEERLRFVPRQPRPEFFAFLRRADVVLDTIGFSGFNTAMQALECAAPIVTLEGRYMRGRFSAGILKEIGLRDAVTNSETAYVDAAVRLCMSADLNHQFRARLQARRYELFDNPEPVDWLGGLLLKAAGPS